MTHDLLAALVAHDGVDALLDVAQHLGGRGSSATAGDNSPACARATWPAKVASRFSRWLRRNRGRAIRSCSSGPQRRVNEDAHALQTVACCDGLPRESLVAFATVILDTLFTCLRAFVWRIRVRGVRRARLTSAWTRWRSTRRARFARTWEAQTDKNVQNNYIVLPTTTTQYL